MSAPREFPVSGDALSRFPTATAKYPSVNPRIDANLAHSETILASPTRRDAVVRELSCRTVLLAAALSGFTPGAAAALQSVSGQEGSSQPFVHEVWTVQNGLPVNAIRRVLQGRDGYLWLATWDGLVRFDGVRFTVFNSEGLPSNRIVELVAGADSSLWMRTDQAHLVRLRAGEFTHFGGTHGLRDRTTLALHIDRKGQVWIGTDHGAFRMEGDSFTAVAAREVRGEVEALLLDEGDPLWVGTRRNGVYRLHGDDTTHYDTATGLASNSVTALRQDPEGGVWIGTAAGVHRYRNGAIQRVARESGRPLEQSIRDVRSSPTSGEVWVASEEGVYSVQGDRLRTAHETPGQASAPIVAVHPGGAVWYAVGDRLYNEGRVAARPLRSRAFDNAAGKGP
jgi:ligand-binding sensor domain-containing protein